jgi:GAF domain-containing protein
VSGVSHQDQNEEVVMTTISAQRVAEVFVEVSDTLVDDFDFVDFLHMLTLRTAELAGASIVGLVLADPHRHLHFMAASQEDAKLLELFQLQNDEGPCLDCFHTGQPIAVSDLDAAAERWPRFAPAALAEGFAAVHALPLRLREEIIGALNLFSGQSGDLSAEDLQVAQALADVATIGILQERAIQHSETLIEQLQGALNSRIIIEQAKGVLAERGGVDMDHAFRQLRAYSRNTNTGLARVARDLVDGHLDANAVLSPERKAEPSKS